MKKILLLGDSIRMGYDKYVKDAFKGTAEVYYPDDNCRFTVYILRYLHEWKERQGFPDDLDLVHWNVGLWDVAELFDDGPLTTREAYKDGIERIHRRIKLLFPNAKQIFATSTPVIERGVYKVFDRHNYLIEEYNAIATEALKDTDCEINDLYPLAKSFPKEYHSDWVHYYTPEGTEQLGGRVIALCCRALGIEAKEINIKDFEPEKYTKEIIGY